MKRVLTASVAAVAVLGAAALAFAQAPPAPPPFPAPKTDVFVYADTVNSSGQQSSEFARGAAVVFRAFAADVKAKKVLTDKDVKYFYVTIPGQPNLKLAYGKVGSRALWTGTWTVPATYPLGLVDFKVLVKTKAKRYGSFVQVAVPTSMLTVV